MFAMRLSCGKSSIVWFSTLAIAVIPVLAHAGTAGRFQFIAGNVIVVDGQGKQRAAQKGAEVEEGETLITAENGSAQVRMIDGGIIALRPGTQIAISAYRYHGKEDGSESALFSLVRGGLRAITGAIGKTHKENYEIKTPTATIGIRGTDHEAVVVLPSQANPANGLQSGTYDKVNVGATSLTTNAGITFVGPNQVGFAASLNQAPVLLPKMPDIFQTAPSSAAKQAPRSAQSNSPSPATQEGSAVSGEPAAVAANSSAASTPASSGSATTNLTGVNSSGSSLNTLNQTLTTGSGSSAIGVSSVRAAGTSGNWFDGAYNYSTSSSTNPNAFRGSVDGGVQQPSQVIEDATGLIGFSGKASGFTTMSGTTSSSGPGSTPTPATIRIGTAVNQDVGSMSLAGIPISWGRWVGGSVGVYSTDGSMQLGTVDNTNRSIHWVTIGNVPSNFLQVPLTGTASYTLAGNTSPTDLVGNVGKLTNATLNADFTNARASTTIGVSFNSPSNTSNWSMTANNIPFSANIEDGFKSNTALNGTNGIVHTVNCTGPSCGQQNIGSVNGHFVLNGQGAAIFYTMGSGKLSSSPNNPVLSFTPASVVTGLVLMKK